VNIVHNFLHTSPLRLLKIRIDNIVYLLSPYQLLSSEGGQIVSNRLWALSLFSIPGALGLGLIIPMFLGLVKKMLSLSGAIFTFIPVLLCALIIGWPKGLGALHFAEAIVVILVGLSVHYLDSLNNKLWLLAAFGINIAQLVYFTAYSYRFAIGEWFKSPQAIATIVGMMLIIGAAGWCMHRLAGDRNNKFLARL